MLCDKYFQNPENISPVLDTLKDLVRKTGPVRLMEICGTHTMAIARTGLKSLLPGEISLISGPGCPVCVTPAGSMDDVLELAGTPGVIIATYGDLLRVPGTHRGDCLLRRRASGAQVVSVYSPVEALSVAQRSPDNEVVFIGVGFETTAPGTAACILEAAAGDLRNFSVLCLLKRTEPALRALITADDFSVDGFLCPGHVAAVTGSRFFSFLPGDFGLPAVVSGFEAADLLYSVLELVKMLAAKKPALVNEYTRVVRPKGNPAAMSMTDQVFQPCSSIWRGLGTVPEGGFSIRPAYSAWDASKKFSLRPGTDSEIPGCRCAQVIRGVMAPSECPLFGTHCTPQDPVGPCMVSSEGSCAAAYRYQE